MTDSRRYLLDAHRPAQAAADATGLAQTVFYHPDRSHSWAAYGAPILRDRKTQQFVTWLPERYFE